MSRQSPRKHSIRIKHPPIISFTTPQKTTQNIPQENTIELPKEIYDSFLNLLTINSIKAFSSKCKEYHLKQNPLTRKDHCLRKAICISILKSSFSNDDKFFLLYEQLFRRFNTLKCEIKCQNRKSDNYFISNISNEDEVNTYEFTCALICFSKNNFNDKLKLLFEITDKDDDGYINEIELKIMIYVINSLFSEEEKPIDSNSTIIHQSLASIKSRQCYLLIMKYPGELSKIFMKNKYVNYNEFYNAIITIPEYRYKLFPFYINFKRCLLSSKNEQNMIIKKSVYNEFANISNNIISTIKSNNDIGKTYTDFKKSLELVTPAHNQLTIQCDDNTNNNNNSNTFNNLLLKKPNSYHGIFRGVSAFISRNSKAIRKSHTKYTPHSYLSTEQTITTPIKNAFATYKTFYKRNMKLRKEEKYKINLNKINGLETFPKKITIDEDIINTNTNINTNYSNVNESTTKKTLTNKNRCVSSKPKTTLTTYNNSVFTNAYMTFNEVITDIKIQRDKHKIRNQAQEMLYRLNTKLDKTANKYRKKLKDQNPYESHKPFGRVDISSKQKPFI